MIAAFVATSARRAATLALALAATLVATLVGPTAGATTRESGEDDAPAAFGYDDREAILFLSGGRLAAAADRRLVARFGGWAEPWMLPGMPDLETVHAQATPPAEGPPVGAARLLAPVPVPDPTDGALLMAGALATIVPGAAAEGSPSAGFARDEEGIGRPAAVLAMALAVTLGLALAIRLLFARGVSKSPAQRRRGRDAAHQRVFLGR